VKLNGKFDPPQLKVKILIVLFIFLAAYTCVRAQTPAPTPAQTPAPTPANDAQVTTTASEVETPEPSASPGVDSAAAAETEAAQKHLTRARSLAAIGKLAAAASELENLRAATKDESVRDVAHVLLMAIFVEMPDYARANALLGEAYKARTTGQFDDAATHSYFAIAGQMVNSVRTHLERYHSFGVNVADASELPTEANGDLDQLRGLLEEVVRQAKALHEEQAKGGDGTRGLDASALLEDAATVRMRLARHGQDRATWQTEVSEARQQLFSSEMRVASISNIPLTRPAAAAQPTPNASAASAKTTQPVPKSSTDDKKSAKKPEQTAQAKKPAETSNAQTPPTASQPGATSNAAPSNNVAKKSDNAPVAVGSLAGKARQRVSPNYPSFARAQRVSGIVTVYLIVNEKGEVETVQRTDGPQQLQQAAADAARRWRFNQTIIDGQPVRVTGYLSFKFSDTIP
jgi:periplasmic protein TonB